MGIHDGHREKMRRRFLQGGLDAFADHEALELLLYYAIPRRDTNPIAHALMDRYGSLSGGAVRPGGGFAEGGGHWREHRHFAASAPLLARKARLAESEKETILNSSERAGRYLLERFAGEKNEIIYQLCLDRKGKLLACKRLTEGGVAGADLNIRQLVSNALLTSASAVILSHNHPSGVALPSQEDYATTARAKEALSTIGVALADHIIVADGDFVSMADSGYLG